MFLLEVVTFIREIPVGRDLSFSLLIKMIESLETLLVGEVSNQNLHNNLG